MIFKIGFYFLFLLALISNTSLFAQEQLGSSSFEVKMLKDARVSPNGKLLVFEAVGKLWKMKYPKGDPEQLFPNSRDIEYDASFSADGKKIIYCSWNTNGFGKLNELDIKAKTKKTLLITSGIYKAPTYSPDGNMVVYKKELENIPTDTSSTKSEGIFLLPLFEKVDPIMLSAYGDYPRFDESNSKVYFEAGEFRLGSFVKTFESVDLNGSNRMVHYNGKYGHEYLFSTDRQRVVWQELGKIYLATIPMDSKKIGITAKSSSIKITEIAQLPGNNLHWSAKENKLHWLIANKYYTADLKDLDKDGKIKIDVSDINLDFKHDEPEGVLAFTNATIITMNGDEVIEHGTIIVKGNKIKEIGFDVKVPKEAFAINCSGKTIMPGFISTEARSNNYEYKLNPLQQWEYIDYLRNGITCKLDGSFRISSTISNRELIQAGTMVGPRLLCGGMRIVDYDQDVFSEDEYAHYTNSNLSIAKAFQLPSIISSDPSYANKGFIVQQASADTSLVSAKDIHEQMIEASKSTDNMLVLKVNTIGAAQKLGFENEIGSLKKDMLADFIILNANPLLDIKNTSELSHILINGRVYDATTMNEVGNYRKRLRTKLDPSIFNSINRAAGSACCGFQH